MKTSIKVSVSLLLMIIILIFIIGCGGSSISGTGGTKEDLINDFDDENINQKFKSSIIDIPENMKLTSITSSGKKSKSDLDKSLAVNVYGSIHLFIKFSDFLKTQVEDFMAVILENKALLTAEPGKLLVIDDESSDLTGILVESISKEENETENWKISFYFNNETNPKMIFRLTLVNNKFRGSFVAEIPESIEVTVDGATEVLAKKYFVKVAFDATVPVNSLAIDISQNISNIMAYAEENWSKLNDEQKDLLDLSQPTKLSLRVTYDGEEYGISGSSYSMGRVLKDELTGDDTILDDDHSTYTFRAKSITGAVDGAKMEVALPVDTKTNITDMWTTDSVASVFRARILSLFNENMNQLLDADDDVDNNLNDDTDFSGDALAEQKIGFQTMYWLLRDNLPVPSLSDHGLAFTEQELTDAQNFWGTDLISEFGVNTLTDLNNYIASTDPTVTDNNKKFVYYIIIAPTVVAYYQTNKVAVTMAELENAIENLETSDDNAFKDAFQSLSHIVNPAFFEKDTGFLGTFNGSDFFVYDKDSNSLNIGSKPENFDTLNALDLDELEAIVPNQVYELDVKVE